MTTFVLIHGAYQGGWIWKPTAEPLRAQGHLVLTPTLDGCAERKGQIRAGIDGVDNGIVKLLAERREWVLQLAKVKRVLGIPIYDRTREQALIDRVKGWGSEHKLNEEFVEVVFRLIVMNSKEMQYHEAV